MKISSVIDDLLTLLALTILADKRVFSQEVEAFLEAARTLQADLDMEANLTNASLLAWFENNRDSLKLTLTHPEFENRVNALFMRVSILPNKQPILERMLSIAASDDEIHVSEQALIILAAKHWNVETPKWSKTG